MSNALTEADFFAIRNCWDAIERDNLAGDWDALAEHLTSDFVQLDPRRGPIYGRDAWQEWGKSLEISEIDGGFDIQEVSGSGDLAYMVWTFEASWSEGGEKVDTTGKGLSVFQRQADGSWLMSRNAWSPNP